MAQAAHSTLSPSLRMIHPSATGYCGKADFEKNAGLNLQLAFGKLPTQCSQQRKEAETHHGQSPGQQGLTNLTFWMLWHFIYSTQLSITLHVKIANSSGNKKCLQLGKDTMKPVA